MSIFSFILNLITSIFDATRKAFNHLPIDIQNKIKDGSGIISIISQYIGQAPSLTIATIQANHSVDLSTLYTGLSAIAKQWGLSIPPTLEELIVVIQNYLKTLQNSEWDRGLSMAAQILGDVFTGASTPFGIIVSVIEFVYNEFIRNKDIVLAVDPALSQNAISAGIDPTLAQTQPIDNVVAPETTVGNV